MSNTSRHYKLLRETKETRVEVEINLDEAGEIQVQTPIRFFNHLLQTLFYYMNAKAKVIAIDKQDYDDHHIIEDTAISIGEAMKNALGDKKGIKRFSSAIIPMDDALILTAIDISGRGYAEVNLNFKRDRIGELATENISHFIRSFAYNSGITIHIIQLKGKNSHHIAEATFKSLGIVLFDATRILYDSVRSTKGVL